MAPPIRKDVRRPRGGGGTDFHALSKEERGRRLLGGEPLAHDGPAVCHGGRLRVRRTLLHDGTELEEAHEKPSTTSNTTTELRRRFPNGQTSARNSESRVRASLMGRQMI